MIQILGFIIFIYSVILHEIAHGFVAEKLGDPTAKISKRLTLNPLPHIDWLMSVILPLLLIVSRVGIIIGAAKPVPIDPYNLKNPRKDMGLIGIAGPLTNLLLAVFFSIIARLSIAYFPSEQLLQLLFYVTRINIVLAIFNLIPIPPVDGGRILAAILPDKYADIVARIEPFGFFILIFLLFFPSQIFSLQGVIQTISSAILSLIFPGLSLI